MNASDDALCFDAAVTLASRVRAGELGARELTAAVLDRIERVNPALNAYVTVCAEQALAAADRADSRLAAGETPGLLHGVPYSAKDLLFTRGVHTTAGSRAYRDYQPTQDAAVVTRMNAAGGILLGKTNTPEFGFKSTTENPLFGATRNPWDRTLTAGGSSGGAGAATAAGMAPLSLGSDAGGSIRTPASFCGIVGFKPTFGSVPTGPGFSDGSTLVHVGPMTRTVEDAALMFDVIAGHDEAERLSVARDARSHLALTREAPQQLTVGFSSDLGYARVEDSVAACVANAVSAFDDAGWDVRELSLAPGDPEDAFNTIIRAENHHAMRDVAVAHADELDPDLLDFTRRGAQLTAAEYLAAQSVRASLCAALAQVFADVDVLVTPTLAVAPFQLDQRPQHIGGHPIAGMNWLSFTYPFNLSGNPACSVPCGFTDTGDGTMVPIGLQIVGPRHADARVLQVARVFEQLRPWAALRPPEPADH